MELIIFQRLITFLFSTIISSIFIVLFSSWMMQHSSKIEQRNTNIYVSFVLSCPTMSWGFCFTIACLIMEKINLNL